MGNNFCDFLFASLENKTLKKLWLLLWGNFSFPTELQIREGIDIDSKIISLFLSETIHCDHSLEPSRWDNSNEGSQYVFMNQ